jgi:L-2-hydroxyglutarate oxidase LhgO
MLVDFDAIVVGAGVIGLAIARELSLAGQSVLVLEKAARAGTETSSRNSEVIHAGIYYPTGSLKAKLCVEGRDLLYDYCATHGVETKCIGKLIVATTREEEAKLESIKAIAFTNGVTDLAWLTPSDVAALEPEVRCTKALLSPSTGIVDARGFMLSLQAVAEERGATFAFNSSFVSAYKNEDRFVVTARDAAGDQSEITCTFLFNCAGHGAHEVASAIKDFPIDTLPPRYFAKGSYCSVSGKSPFHHLVYPVPVSGALGIHATLDMGGALRFGPDITWTDKLDYALPEGLPEKFSTSVQSYWPGVRDRTLSPSYCGVRPKIHGSVTGFADFLVLRRKQHGIQGLTNLFGIESPGLTASLSIAKLVCCNF